MGSSSNGGGSAAVPSNSVNANDPLRIVYRVPNEEKSMSKNATRFVAIRGVSRFTEFVRRAGQVPFHLPHDGDQMLLDGTVMGHE